MLVQENAKEKTMNQVLVSVFAIATMFGSAIQAAEQCTNATLRGTYAFHGLAFIVTASGGAATPRAIIGVFTLDGKGNWTTSLTINDNGVITHPPAAGSVGRPTPLVPSGHHRYLGEPTGRPTPVRRHRSRQ